MDQDGFYERRGNQERDINTSADLRSGVYKVMALIMCGDWERRTRIYFEETAMLFYFFQTWEQGNRSNMTLVELQQRFQ